MARAGRTLARVGSRTEFLATPEKAFPAVNARRANDNATASAGLIRKNRELKAAPPSDHIPLGRCSYADITSFTRFKCDKPEELVKRATQAKAIFEKHGAEFLRMSRFHTGMWAGEWLVVTRYASWKCTAGRRRQWQRTKHSRS